MSHQIDPLILQKLEAFARRRRKLIIFRGVCAALATLLVTMMLIALIDRLFRLPDGLRWGLSLAAYATVIIVEWRSCLRLLLHAPGPRKLARLVEHAEPKLREDLLSAVELGDTKSDAAFDSEQFRALLQTDVAQRMEGMNVDRLLPVNLVRRYIGLAAVIFVACIVAFALSGGQFGTLLLRALAPGANLDRVSRVKVKVVQPVSPDMVVAQGETIPLVIELSGQRAHTAEVEMLTATGAERVKMTAIGPDRFSASIQVGRDDVLYRIYAGDAVTKKHRLHAVARPHVVKFDKTYHFPAYARFTPKNVSEENGDLAGLEGSEVELRIATNQRIKDGELRLEQGKKNTVVPLKAEGATLVGRVPLDASGTYRVQLVSAETGFENKFSPEYELRAEPDLVPQVELEKPKQDLILPNNEVVTLQGMAKDDQSLARVFQVVKVNDGKWQEVPLASEPGAQVVVERNWDLFEQGVKPGDLITTKLVAIDLKGSRGESRPLQITVTESGFESKRLEALEAQRALHDALKALRLAGETLEKRSNETREQFEKLSESDPQRRTVAVSAGAALSAFEEQGTAAWTQLITTLRAVEGGHPAADLTLVGRRLAGALANGSQLAREALDLVTAAPESPAARDLFRDFADSAVRAGQRARAVEESFLSFLRSEELQVIGENLHIVAREQERLAGLAQNAGNDKEKWVSLANRMRIVLAETRNVEQLMTASAARGGGDRLKQAARRLEELRLGIERTIAAGEPGKALTEATRKLTAATAEVSRGGLQYVRDQAQSAVSVHSRLLADVAPAYANFERLREELPRVAGGDKLPPEIRSRRAAKRWELRGEMLRLHGDAEEARADSDSEFVNDVRLSTRALEGLALKAAGAPVSQANAPLIALEKEFRLLENGHNLAEVLSGLNLLAVAERWELISPRSRTTNPRAWKWLETRLRMLPDELGKVQPEAAPLRETIEEARQLLWGLQKLPAWNGVGQEMNERFNPERDPRGVPADTAQLAAQVKRALDLMRTPMAEARERMAELAPKLSEIMAQLAKETEALKKETEEQAQQAAEKSPDAATAAAKQALAEQQRLNERVETVKDALRAEANRQDILQAEGREAARDADDALALLREPPPKAESALETAAETQLPSAKAEALADAAKEQQKLADALKQLAGHYANAEQGKAEETRTALRATEEATGIKAAMDEQAARAELLAQMAENSPEEMLKKLEAALPQNPAMQKELSQIAQDTLTNAATKLAEAAQAEAQVAQLVTEMAAQPAPQPPAAQTPQQAAMNAKEAAKQAVAAAEAAREAANEAVQAAKQANNPAAADQARKARGEAEQARQSAEQAAQAAEQMNNPQQMAQAAHASEQKAGEAAQNAQEAAQAAQQAQTTAQQAAAQQNGDQQAKNQQTSKEAGEAVQAAQKAAMAAQQAQAAAQQAAAMAQATPGGDSPQMAQNAQAPSPGQNATPSAPQPSRPANPMLAQAAQQQQPIAQNAAQAGEEVSRAGRHEERLMNAPAGQQLQQLGAEIAETAMTDVPVAQQALNQAQQAGQAQQAVAAANSELRKELGQLQAAASQPSPAPATPTNAQSPATPAEASAAQPMAAAPAQSSPLQAASAPASSPSAPSSPAPSAPVQPGAATPAPSQVAAAAPASPQEQVWMARTLDALDAVVNAPPTAMAPDAEGQQAAPSSEAGQQAQAAQSPQGSPNAAQAAQAQSAQAAAQAQQAMAAAAQAAASAMRNARAETPGETPGAPTSSSRSAVSKGGAQAEADGIAKGALPDARARGGDWGKLPKQMAEQLTRGQNESVAGEYRHQVETYYRVIAEKSKKP